MIGRENIGALNAARARSIVRACVAQGVRHAVVSPGSRNTPVLLALAAANIDVRVILDERAAGVFALGLSKAAGSPTLLSCTSGSAGANYLPAVVEASHGRTAIVVVTADRPEELQGCGAPQTMNQIGLYGSFCGRSEHLPAPQTSADVNDTEALVETLVQYAAEHRGPVHLNVAFREPLWDGGSMPDEVALPREVIAPRPLDIDPSEFSQLCGFRGVFVCGPDTVESEAQRTVILAAAERLGWPVLAEASSGVRFGADHVNLVTTYDAVMRSDTSDALAPEVVVRFGKTSTSRALNEWLSRARPSRFLLVDSSPVSYDPDQLAHQHIRVSAAHFCEQLMTWADLHPCEQTWLERWQRCEAGAQGLIATLVKSSWWEGAVAHRVLASLPEGAALHLANSMPIRDVDSVCIAGGRHLRVFTNRGVNGIDGTVATAIGEANGVDDGPMVLLVGDLAFLHDAASLALAGAKRITIVVVDNRGGGIFGFLPIAKHPTEFERLFITEQETDPAAVALAYGARVECVTNDQDLKIALAEEIEREGVGVIVAKVSRQENIDTHQRMWSQVATMMEALS